MIASQRGHLEVVRLFHRPVANPVVPKINTHYPYSQTFPCNAEVEPEPSGTEAATWRYTNPCKEERYSLRFGV